MTVKVTTTVNGKPVSGDVEPNTLLVEFVRENLGLTGTHVGCDTSQCGACTVHFDGKPVKSCTILAVQAEGHQVVTIEGIGQPGNLHPMQAAFQENHGLQCGFCTPGMIMTTAALIKEHPAPTDEQIVHGLEGNICRCTGYLNIVKAVKHAAALQKGK